MVRRISRIGGSTLSRRSGHELVKLRVARDRVGERDEGAAETQEAVSGIGVGDVAHLRIGNVQELGKLGPVSRRLIEQQ